LEKEAGFNMRYKKRLKQMSLEELLEEKKYVLERFFWYNPTFRERDCRSYRIRLKRVKKEIKRRKYDH